MTDLNDKTLFITGASRGTGNLLFEDDVLKSEGVADPSRYAVDPAAELIPNFFV